MDITRPTSPPLAAVADPASTGVMKALVLVDGLREERRSADDERLAALMKKR